MKPNLNQWRLGELWRVMRCNNDAVRQSLLLGIPTLLFFLALNGVVAVNNESAQDSDGDQMPDVWELKFGLDPSNAADALIDSDADGLTNLWEYAAGSDPLNQDTDADFIFDGPDLYPVSRAYIRWGDPDFTEGDAYDYTAPAWLLGSYRVDGEWSTNPVSWHVQEAESNDVGSLNVDLDRNILTTNSLRYRIKFFDSTSGMLFMDLLDTNGTALVTDLFGNIQSGSSTKATVILDLPLATYTNAAVLHLRRHSGETRVFESLIYIDQDADNLDRELEEQQLQTSDNQIDTDGDGLSDFDEVFVYGTDPANPDTDGDGMPDGWEVAHNLNPLVNDAALDPDNDGLTNLQEYQRGTDPANADTDGDGMKDGDEVRHGKDPLSANVYAGVPFTEGFEPSDTVQLGALHGQHGWEVNPTNGAFVQSATVYEGAQALALTNNNMETDTAVQQLLVSTDQVVWVELAQRTDPRDAPGGPVYAAASWYFNWDGRLVVYDGLAGANGAWVTLTNHTPFTTAQWVRVAARINYGTRRWNVYVNRIMLASNLGISALAGERFTALKLKGQSGYADNVMVALTPPADVDSDGDGMPDEWELAHGLDPDDSADAALDSDNDGLTNLQEYQRGTDPANPDTDGDGMPDGWEVAHNLNPLANDAALDPDNDSLTNLQEYQYGADPANPDTDGDGMPDGWELAHNLNPLVNDAALDPDNDGLTNLQEYQYGTNPAGSDTDGDGYSDGVEVQWGVDPNSASSYPHATISGLLTYTGPQTGTIYVALSTNSDGANISRQILATNVYAFTNVPALRTYWLKAWRDSNINGTNDFWEAQGAAPTNPVYLIADVTNADIRLSDPDTDGDELPDWWEMQWFGTLAYGANDDPDGDGLTNMQEYLGGLNPTSTSPWPHRAISGALTYAGPQTGTIYVVLTTNGISSGIVQWQALSQPGVFAFTNVPALRAYWIKAWRDSNRNGINDFWEARGDAPANPLYLIADVANADISLSDPDTDGDDLPDWWEMQWFGTLAYGANDDPDHDGLTNLQEYQRGTDPANPDTDGDGMKDGDEVRHGKDPLSANVYAGVPFTEGFEPSDTVQLGALHGQHGWEVNPTNGAFVQSATVYEGAQALALADNTGPDTAAQQLLVSTDQVVWVELAQRAEPRDAPGGPVYAAASWYFNWDGRLVVYDGLAGANGAWVTLTNHTPYAWPQWVRVGARINYGTRRWHVYVNRIMLAGNLGISALAGERFTALKLRGQGGYADNVMVALTPPVDVDSDGDGMPDEWELEHGLDPDDAADAALDSDNDGLTNLQEYQYGTDPANPDTDGDGLRDSAEVDTYFTDPLNADTDADGLTDGAEVNTWGTDPLKADTDGDGMPDGWELAHNLDPLVNDAALDPDNDGLTNLQEYQHGADPANPDTDFDHLLDGYEAFYFLTDPAKADTDGDGLNDWWELRYGMNALVPDNTLADPDSDALNNGIEEGLLTNPHHVDGDGDGMPDKWEHDHGLNPAGGEAYSLASWWRGDEASGSRLPDDVRLWDNTGNLYNGAQYRQLAGSGPSALVRHYLDVSASNAYAIIPNHFSLSTTNAFTLALRVLRGPLSQTAILASKVNALSQAEFILMYDPVAQQLQFSHKNAANQSETVGVACLLSANIWTHLAVTVTNNHVVFYQDGIMLGTTQTLVYDRSVLGDFILGPGSPYAGRAAQPLALAQIRIYQAALPADQINALLEGQADADGDTLTNLEEYEYGTNPHADDRSVDSDGDGLSNYDEIRIHGTNPFNADSDGDGVSDGAEVAAGTNPLIADQGGTRAMQIIILSPQEGEAVLP